MTQLDYLTDAPYSCSADDVNVMAFSEAATIIRGHATVEDFLPCGICPLSEGWEVQVEMESPLSRVTVSMPKVIPIIGKQEAGAAFEAWIAAAVNQLVGNYNATGHNACAM
jgi:hypothetical protein